ncbi:MAG TPA: hypothetical protein VL173_11430 [Vicinamibacterales bacterium]|nr:hypothetical protein [Vicinamibacterales bacterium]
MVLWLDVALVILYFILVRTVEVRNGVPEVKDERMPLTLYQRISRYCAWCSSFRALKELTPPRVASASSRFVGVLVAIMVVASTWTYLSVPLPFRATRVPQAGLPPR